MSWTYSGNPGSSAKDLLRFLIGDTDQCDQLLQDGEILWLLSQYGGSPKQAAIRACETITAKFSRMADESVGTVKITFSQKAKAYITMKKELQRRLATEDMTPFAGGISITQKITEAQNADRVRPDFTKHMMENDLIAPWVTSQDIGRIIDQV